MAPVNEAIGGDVAINLRALRTIALISLPMIVGLVYVTPPPP